MIYRFVILGRAQREPRTQGQTRSSTTPWILGLAPLAQNDGVA